MKINIHKKITLAFILILTIIFLSIYFYLNLNFKMHTYNRIRNTLLKETSFVKTFLEREIERNKELKNTDKLADIIGNDLKLRVTIISLDGTVLGDSNINKEKLLNTANHLERPEIQEALISGIGEKRRFSTTVEKEMLYVASTFGVEKHAGILRLSVPLSEIKTISDNLKKLLLYSLALAFILAIIISYPVSLFISKPIKELSYTAASIAKGELPKSISYKGHDEIGELANAFTYMTSQIRHRVDEVTINKSRLEAVLYSMFEGVMVVNNDGTILLINEKLKSFLQINETPKKKKTLEVIRNSSTKEMVDKSLQLESGVISEEITVFTPKEKILLVHASPIIRDSVRDGAVLVFHDITELRHLEKVRQDFVANVSHELRTPVTTIKGYSETLIDGALNDKENAEKFLKIIHEDAIRLSLLIDDLLDLSGIESGKLTLTFKELDSREIVNQVISKFKNKAKENLITLKTDIPENLDKIFGDKLKISQVFSNLIDNAIKYNKNGGNVTVSAIDEGLNIKFIISDTGIGVPKEDLNRLFERFYRVDKARSHELGGTGLGLSIVKHIIQSHNGNISVRSTLGQGSAFTLTIPKSTLPCSKDP